MVAATTRQWHWQSSDTTPTRCSHSKAREMSFLLRENLISVLHTHAWPARFQECSFNQFRCILDRDNTNDILYDLHITCTVDTPMLLINCLTTQLLSTYAQKMRFVRLHNWGSIFFFESFKSRLMTLLCWSFSSRTDYIWLVLMHRRVHWELCSLNSKTTAILICGLRSAAGADQSARLNKTTQQSSEKAFLRYTFSSNHRGKVI